MALQTPTRGTKSINYGVLIVCEDEKSNFFYIDRKVSSCKPVSNSVEIVEFDLRNSTNAGGAQTDKLMAYAIQRIKELNDNFSNGGSEPEAHFYREVYCIGDIDDNETNGGKVTIALSELAAARLSTPEISYQLLLSNECFEIWYILHFQDIVEPLYRGTIPQINAGLMAAANTNRIKDVLKAVSDVSFGNQKTTADFFDIMQDQGDEAKAIERAKLLDTTPAGAKFPTNPSTQVYILIERLNRMKTI